MGALVLSKNTTKLLSLRKNIITFDPSTTEQKVIDDFNRTSFDKKRKFKALFRPVRSGVDFETFIIPVSNTASITSYLFKKTKRISGDPSSMIIYIHEGGWTLGNMDTTKAVCSNICKMTGAIVLAVDYRLSPAFKFPIPVEDCYNAFLWAYNGAKYWKADPAKVYLMGSSCGANIVAAVCQMARDNKGPIPAGQILVDPITDCRLRTSSFETYKDSPFLNQKQLTKFIQNYQREPKDILDPLLSPLLSKDLSRLPETLILAAQYDILYEDALLYEKALQDADTNAKLITREGSFHGSLSFPKSERWEDYMTVISDFVHSISVKRIELTSKSERSRKRRKTVSV